MSDMNVFSDVTYIELQADAEFVTKLRLALNRAEVRVVYSDFGVDYAFAVCDCKVEVINAILETIRECSNG